MGHLPQCVPQKVGRQAGDNIISETVEIYRDNIGDLLTNETKDDVPRTANGLTTPVSQSQFKLVPSK